MGGKFSRTIQAVEHAIASASSPGPPPAPLEAQLASIRLLLATEGLSVRDEIEEKIRAGIAFAEGLGLDLYVPFFLVERAALARELGDEESWRRQLREAQRLFNQMGAAGQAERIRRELAMT